MLVNYNQGDLQDGAEPDMGVFVFESGASRPAEAV